MTNQGPLSGYVVVELASVLAGPSVGMFLAELGARVIKVENSLSGGDVTRSWKLASEPEGESVTAYFSAFNWGKESIALNLAHPAGKNLVHLMVKKADIVIASFKAGDGKKLGVDGDTLCALNPGLIYGEITGYGKDDPRTAFDAMLQAETGFMFMNGTPESGPQKMPVALIDVLAGHQLKEGILLALLEKSKSGKGKQVSVSLFDTGIASLANQAANYLVAGHIPQRMGSAHPNIVPYGDYFETRDGKYLMIAAGNDRQYQSLCSILGIQSPAEFSDNPGRVKHRNQVNTLLKNAISGQDASSLLESLQKEKVPAALIESLDTVFQKPRVKDLMLQGRLKGVRTAVFQPQPEGLTSPPTFNENRDAVLRQFLGLEAREIQTLLEEGAII